MEKYNFSSICTVLGVTDFHFANFNGTYFKAKLHANKRSLWQKVWLIQAIVAQPNLSSVTIN